MATSFSKDRYASDKVRSATRKVTPEEAMFILEECNSDNRPVRKTKVRAYAKDMLAGTWALNGEAIIFDKNGDLADGQHRLQAVVESGVTIDTFVTYGVERDTRLTLDMGAARNVRDARSFMGMGEIKNGPTVDAIARIMVRKERDGMEKIPSGGGSVPITNADIVQWTSENLEVAEEAAAVGRSVQHATACINPAAAGFAKMMLDEVDASASAEFFRLIVDGIRKGAGDPLVAMERTIRDQRLRAEQQVAVMIFAWNAWRAGEERSKFWSKTFATGAEMPKPI